MISMSTPAMSAAGPRARALSPMRKFQAGLVIGDTVVVTSVVALGHVSRFGFRDPDLGVSGLPLPTGYVLVSVLIACAWLVLLRALHTYREILLGSGTEEYARVLEATFTLFGLLAIGSYLFQVQLSRWYFVVVLPLGLLFLLLWRWIARQVLVSRRARGSLRTRAIIVGTSSRCARMLRELKRKPQLGVDVVAACSAPQSLGTELKDTGVIVRGNYDSVVSLMERLDAQLIIVAGATDLPPEALRKLTWQMDPRSRLVVAPAIVDIAGPRIHLRPVDGLPLMEVSAPRMDGLKLFVKRAVDIIASALLIVLFLPVWIVVPLLIKLDDRGPVFFKQIRIGQDGREFRIVKFRSMRVNADAELKKLLEQQGTADKPLFKVENDPRITKLGAFLRKSSIDELPQLFNVFGGSMSLVGPRPQVPAEVALYDEIASRWLIAKPGVTGLWQVNGRSKLSWEEAIRYDLYYVENWSLTGDLQILFRTIKVVLQKDGSQ